MARLQYQRIAAPVSTAPERTSCDKWFQNASIPNANWAQRKRSASVICAAPFLALTLFSANPVERSSIDKWHQPLSTPRAAIKRNAALHGIQSSAPVTPYVPQLNAWINYPSSTHPIFRKPLQYLTAQGAFTSAPKALPDISCLAMQQVPVRQSRRYIHDSYFGWSKAPLPNIELISAAVPSFTQQRRASNQGLSILAPLYVARAILLDWLGVTEQPIRTKARLSEAHTAGVINRDFSLLSSWFQQSNAPISAWKKLKQFTTALFLRHETIYPESLFLIPSYLLDEQDVVVEQSQEVDVVFMSTESINVSVLNESIDVSVESLESAPDIAVESSQQIDVVFPFA